jgi:hypothetical protein
LVKNPNICVALHAPAISRIPCPLKFLKICDALILKFSSAIANVTTQISIIPFIRDSGKRQFSSAFQSKLKPSRFPAEAGNEGRHGPALRAFFKRIGKSLERSPEND